MQSFFVVLSDTGGTMAASTMGALDIPLLPGQVVYEMTESTGRCQLMPLHYDPSQYSQYLDPATQAWITTYIEAPPGQCIEGTMNWGQLYRAVESSLLNTDDFSSSFGITPDGYRYVVENGNVV